MPYGTTSLGCRVALVAMAASAGGCMRGSLASDTGPRETGRWSVAKKQYAHVGERVHFSFIVVPVFGAGWGAGEGLVDYAEATIGQERIDVPVDADGRATFQYTFETVTDERTGVPVAVAAYRTRGRRDEIQVGGQWINPLNSDDLPDEKLASDKLTMVVYQSRIDIALPAAEGPYLWRSGRLTIRKADGTRSEVFFDRPARPGYTVSGPDARNEFHVVYLPRADQVNKTGATEATFVVRNTRGREVRKVVWFETP